MNPKRLEAASAGLTRYEGRQCERCGGTMRYVANDGCVPCQNASVRQFYARKRQQKNQQKAPTA